MSPCSFPKTITITPRAPPLNFSDKQRDDNSTVSSIAGLERFVLIGYVVLLRVSFFS